MNTLLFLSLVASVLLFARVDADPCGINACSYTCSRTLEDLQRTCGGSIISADSCGCCGMCAKLEGESCGGYHDIGGTTCDIGLTCQPVGDKKFIFGGLGKCVRINPMTTVQPSTGTSEVNESDTKSPTPASTTGTRGVKSDTKTQTPASTTGTSPASTTGMSPASTTGTSPASTTGMSPASTTGTSGVKPDTKTQTPARTTGTSGVKSDTKTQTPSSTTGTSGVKLGTETQTPASTTGTSGVKPDTKTQTPSSTTGTSGVKSDSKKTPTSIFEVLLKH